jgi:hypothetical protein
MSKEFAEIFATLKPVFTKYVPKLVVKEDKPTEYTLVTKKPSIFPQHKGEPMWFGAIKIGKAYVSVHILALYMNPKLEANVTPELKKRMQGKACFNFKTPPEKSLIADLKKLMKAAIDDWAEKKWL